MHDERIVEDQERGAWMRLARWETQFPGSTMLLSINGAHVHMDVQRNTHDDPARGQTYVLSSITSFGSDVVVTRLTGVPAHRFRSKAEAHAALMLGIEALLVFGNDYNGLELPDKTFRVRAATSGQTRDYVLADFPGY